MNISMLSYYLRLPVSDSHGTLLCPSLTVTHSVLPPSLPSVPLLELNCFLQGDDAGNVFPVKIARTESVGTLKEAIKEKKLVAFERVDADSLKLWKVSISDDGLKENVSNVIRDEEALSPVVQLSDVFTEVLIRKHVHIIVKSPRIGEWKRLVGCWVNLISTFQPPNQTRVSPPLHIHMTFSQKAGRIGVPSSRDVRHPKKESQKTLPLTR
jgi:hypothetical protein